MQVLARSRAPVGVVGFQGELGVTGGFVRCIAPLGRHAVCHCQTRVMASAGRPGSGTLGVGDGLFALLGFAVRQCVRVLQQLNDRIGLRRAR